MAENQTAGRGQGGTQWLSRPGENLILSIFYQPTFLPARQQFLLSMAVALGIRRAVEIMLPETGVFIKWPNDIYVNGRKVCGILIENTLQGSVLSGSIIGIGLNVLQDSFPGLPLAASLANFGYSQSLTHALHTLLGQVEQYYLRLRSGHYEQIRNEYQQHLFGKGEMRRFRDAQGTFSGMIRQVDETGILQIETPRGFRYFAHKEVIMLPD